MGSLGVSKDRTSKLAPSLFVSLLFLLPMLGGCYSTGHPRYQPFSQALFIPQGYKDIAIDERTYLVLYKGYYSGSLKNGLLLWEDAMDEKWLLGAQEYALYRAGELAKSKGAKYFVVLQKDDWSLLEIMGKGGKLGPNPVIHPGAGLIIRVLNESSSPMPSTDDRVYEVDKLLQDLTQRNNGLAANHNQAPSGESSANAGHKFVRWRSSVSGYDSPPVSGQWVKPLLAADHFKVGPGIQTTRLPNGNYEVVASVERFSPIMPISLLRDCALLADKMGFEVLTLRNWTVEEHRDFIWSDRFRTRVWFRMTVEVSLQHHKELESLDPVFVVDEIRSNVMKYEW